MVLLHKSQKHQLNRVESQLSGLFPAQVATEFVESGVSLVVLTDELGAQELANWIKLQSDVETKVLYLKLNALAIPKLRLVGAFLVLIG